MSLPAQEFVKAFTNNVPDYFWNRIHRALKNRPCLAENHRLAMHNANQIFCSNCYEALILPVSVQAVKQTIKPNIPKF